MNANNKSTLAYTYGADELVYTILCNTVHMCEMLLKVNEWDFDLAQRALDSLREKRGKKWLTLNNVSVQSADVQEVRGFYLDKGEFFEIRATATVFVDN